MKNSETIALVGRLKALRNLIHKKKLGLDRVNNSLFHFTNEAGLKGIIKSNSLLMTSFKKLNDEFEFSFLKSEVFKILSDLSDRENQAVIDFFIGHFDEYVSEIQLFTVSLCENKMNGILWERYADNHKGYALGFSDRMFRFAKKNDLEIIPDWPIVFLKVNYGKEKAYTDLREFIKVFSKLVKSKRYNHIINFENYARKSFLFASNIFVSMPRYKSTDWQEENEHRFFMMDKGLDQRIPIQDGERPSIGNVVTNHLVEIIIGKDAALSQKDIEEILKASSYDLSKIKIEKLT